MTCEKGVYAFNSLFKEFVTFFKMKKKWFSNVPWRIKSAYSRRYVLVLARDPSLQAGPTALRARHAPLLERMVAGSVHSTVAPCWLSAAHTFFDRGKRVSF